MAFTNEEYARSKRVLDRYIKQRDEMIECLKRKPGNEQYKAQLASFERRIENLEKFLKAVKVLPEDGGTKSAADTAWDKIIADPKNYAGGEVRPINEGAGSKSLPVVAKQAERPKYRWLAVAEEDMKTKEYKILGVHQIDNDANAAYLAKYFGVVTVEQWELSGLEADIESAIYLPVEFYREEIKLHQKGFTPGSCVFDSTTRFLANQLGVGLSNEDKRYFDGHPVTEPHGTPMAYTARVVQEVIDPYGLRVCRIRVEKGLPPRGDLAEWMTYLGCNPLASTDYRTTNAEWAAMTGIPLETVNAQYGFEFHDEPLKPSVVCEASKAHQYDAPHGHASYLPPRGKTGEWWMSLQIDRSPFPFAAKPVYEPYKAVEIREPHLWAICEAVRKYDREQEAEQRRLAAQGTTASEVQSVH